MNALCIVPCGKKKIWDVSPDAGPTEARSVYMGSLVRKGVQYAEMFYPSSWCILSAKYGFIRPDELIPGPYNVTFNDPTTGPVAVAMLTKQAREKGLTSYDEIVVVGGARYEAIARAVFEKEIVNPLTGCKGIGFMLQRLDLLMERRESRL